MIRGDAERERQQRPTARRVVATRAHPCRSSASSVIGAKVRELSSQRAASTRGRTAAGEAHAMGQQEVGDDRRRRGEQPRAEGDAAEHESASRATSWNEQAGRESTTRRRRPSRRAVATSATTHARARTPRRATTRPASSLAAITRVRRGTRLNVICAVRCDHSEETSSTPTTGPRMLAGWIAAAEHDLERLVLRLAEIDRIATTPMIVSATIASCSQKPARVSVILRSSTSVSRPRPGRASRPARRGRR